MNEQVRIAPHFDAAPLQAFTARDFLEMIEIGGFQDMRAELVRGELQKMAPAHGDHGRTNASLIHSLANAVKSTGLLAVDLAVLIDEFTVRGVDIALGRAAFTSGPAKGSDLLLAVEIADTTLARDLGEKAADYARAGIPTYWVVDLSGRAVHVMTDPGDAGYAGRCIVRFGEALKVPGTSATITVD